MIIQNQTNGRTKTVGGFRGFIFCLLFGPLYFAVHGAWKWSLFSFVTFNGLLIGFPLFNATMLKSSYRDRGWNVLN